MTFRDWAQEESVLRFTKLDQFRGKRIAFDAEHYLHSLLTDAATKEPLLPALGGLPFAIRLNIDRDLKRYQTAGIAPTFVFNGLDVASRDRSAIASESKKAASTLAEAWSTYDQGNGDKAVGTFAHACM
jgi:hypothetical protein